MARPSLEGLPKFKALVRRLAIPKPYVRGLLDTMWDACHTNGDPRLGSPEEVEAAAEWPGARGEFFEALRERWLDESTDEPGIYLAHDYWDHAPKYAKDRALREAERRAAGVTLSDLRRASGRLGGLAKAGKTLANDSKLLKTSSKGLANGSTPAPAPAPVSDRDTPTSIPQVSLGGVQGGPEAAAPRAGQATDGDGPGGNGHRTKPPRDVLTIPARLTEEIPGFEELWKRRVKPVKGKLPISSQNGQLQKLLEYLDVPGPEAICEALRDAELAAWQALPWNRLQAAKDAAQGGGRGHPRQHRLPTDGSNLPDDIDERARAAAMRPWPANTS